MAEYYSCDECGKRFLYRDAITDGNKWFCSESCKDTYNRKNRRNEYAPRSTSSSTPMDRSTKIKMVVLTLVSIVFFFVYSLLPFDFSWIVIGVFVLVVGIIMQIKMRAPISLIWVPFLLVAMSTGIGLLIYGLVIERLIEDLPFVEAIRDFIEGLPFF